MRESKTVKVRTRFAPSPTGFLHIGGVRTALYNWLFAKHYGGQFILRIEDTDKERSKPEFEEDIKMGLGWLDLKWDEFYRQSDRVPIYREYLEKLLAEGKLYHCFCSKEDLESERQAMLSQGIPPKYSGRCGGLSKEQVKSKLDAGAPYVLRFRVPGSLLSVKDIIRGTVKFDTSLIGDMIIARDLDQPLYNFTVVVDDALMEVSHVIRGEEHLSNTPKQVLIAEALGFELPQFAHLPMILNPDRSKMSKRFGDTAFKEYVSGGYLKEALINFIAYLGWHPKEDKEVMTIDELVKEFDLKRAQKGGAVFNVEKLDWLNSYYLSRLDADKFIEEAERFVPPSWKLTPAVVASVKNRIKKMNELKDLVSFYFELPDYDSDLLVWKNMEISEVKESLEKSLGFVSGLPEGGFKSKFLEDNMNALVGSGDRGKLFWPLRVALSGQKASPGPFEIMEALGKEESVKRIKKAIEKCAG